MPVLNRQPPRTYTVDDVTVGTTHFNPARFERTWQTYYEWLPNIGSIADWVICYECVLDDDEQEIEGSTIVRGTRERHGLWQKEPLLQLALDRCTTPLFCWIDHDIHFLIEDWLERGIALLRDGVEAVQLFREFIRYDADGTSRSTSTVMKGGYCPGGAWVARADWLRSIGGFPYHMILGWGDQELYRRMKGRCTYLNTPAYHIWHGDHADRQHDKRQKMLDAAGFNPSMIKADTNGLACWTDHPGVPAVRTVVDRYFANRREDGNKLRVVAP